MSLISDFTGLMVILCQESFNLKRNQLTGAVSSEISIMAETFSVITTGAMITACGNCVAHN